MIRFVLLFSVLAAPLAAQTALNDRPGRWISIPRAEVPLAEAPLATGVVLEAPEAGPLITADPAPSVILTTPDAAETAVLITPPVIPQTRPVPRPREIIAAVDVPAVEVPVAEVPAVEVLAVEAPAVEAPVVEAPLVEVATAEAPMVEVPGIPARESATLEAAAPQVAPEVVEVAPEPDPEPVIEVATLAPVLLAPAAPEATLDPATRPVPRPETAETAALAEALAAQIAAEARAIAVAAPRPVPLVDEIIGAEVLAPPRAIVIPEVAAPTPAPARVLSPPRVVPTLTAAFARAARTNQPLAMSAVLLPARTTVSRPAAQPVAFVMPPVETAPILPRLRPSGPAALDGVIQLTAALTAPLSAVLLPSPATQPAPVPRLARAPAPGHDLFPLSALPPSELPAGPDSMMRAIQPPRPFAEANAAVLTGLPPVVPVRMPVLVPSAVPEVDALIADPDAPAELPAPDPNAVARMMEDAMICWRMADVGLEAQWARLSVDVALDETNMPSGPSIRLTGFARVVSGAAEEAYRAAHAALMGCAEATGNEPATTSATLIFDRSGVRLQ